MADYTMELDIFEVYFQKNNTKQNQSSQFSNSKWS